MILGFALFTTFFLNLWTSWSLGFPMNIVGGFSLPIGFIIFIVSIPVIIILSGTGGVALGLVGMLFGKHDDRKKGQKFLSSFLRGWGWLTVVFWVIPWILFGAIKITNDRTPATLPRITISNGEKTVIFQSMMHVASPGFYSDIKKDMQRLRAQDYVFFYEGVRRGSTASMEKLSQLMGTEVSPEMYDTLAEVGGLVFQGDETYVDILPSTNVDLSTDEIVALADKSNISIPAEKQINIAKVLKEKSPTFSPLQKYVALTLSRGAMNMLLRNYTEPSMAKELSKIIPVFAVILDKRNEHLVDAIVKSPSEHIYIHYGALHFAGVLKGLQEKDPRWHEINRTSYTVIR